MDIAIGDTVFVHAPRRNIADPRPVFGEYPVVGVYPNHACGPCVYIKDEHGDTAIHWRYCLPLATTTKGPQ